jgi:hypothetical protein
MEKGLVEKEKSDLKREYIYNIRDGSMVTILMDRNTHKMGCIKSDPESKRSLNSYLYI